VFQVAFLIQNLISLQAASLYVTIRRQTSLNVTTRHKTSQNVTARQNLKKFRNFVLCILGWFFEAESKSSAGCVHRSKPKQKEANRSKSKHTCANLSKPPHFFSLWFKLLFCVEA
jgi:hypothetical protein